MKKSLLELQYLEEQKIKQELEKIEEANKYYKKLSFYKTLAIVFFILNLFVIIFAGVSEYMILNLNSILISLVIVLFSVTSLVLLSISVTYKNKTLIALNRHYN